MKQGTLIKEDGKERDALDRYYTPAWCTEALLSRVKVVGEVLEPCAGRGGISDVLRVHGLEVTTGDIDDVCADHRWDFLQVAHNIRSYPWVITNPPYRIPGSSHASDFVRAALKVAPCVAMLLRLSFLEACQDRLDLLRDTPPAQVIIIGRISFENGGGHTDRQPSAWCVWLPGVVEAPRIHYVWPDEVEALKAKHKTSQLKIV